MKKIRWTLAAMLCISITVQSQTQAVIGVGAEGNKKEQQAAPTSPAPADGLIIQAEKKKRKGDYKGALEDVNDAINFRPSDCNAYFTRGEIKQKMLNYAEALEDFDQYIALCRVNRHKGHMAKSKLNMEKGDYQAALDEINAALSAKPDWGEAYYHQGLIYIKLSQDENACEAFKKGKKLFDDNCIEAHKNNCKKKKDKGADAGN